MLGQLNEVQVNRRTHRIALKAIIPLIALSRGSRCRARIPNSSNERPTIECQGEDMRCNKDTKDKVRHT